MKRRGGGNKAAVRVPAKDPSASISDDDEGSQAEDEVDEEGDVEASDGDDDGLFPDFKFNIRRRVIGPSPTEIVTGHYCEYHYLLISKFSSVQNTSKCFTNAQYVLNNFFVVQLILLVD